MNNQEKVSMLFPLTAIDILNIKTDIPLIEIELELEDIVYEDLLNCEFAYWIKKICDSTAKFSIEQYVKMSSSKDVNKRTINSLVNSYKVTICFSLDKLSSYYLYLNFDNLSSEIRRSIHSIIINGIGKEIPAGIKLNCQSLVALEYVNIENVTVLLSNQAFKDCIKLTEVDSNCDIEVSNLAFLFENCYQIRFISKLVLTETANTIAYRTFSFCTNLHSSPILTNTGCLTNLTEMFLNCKSLEIVNSFDVTNVEDTSRMFHGCENLKDFPLLTFDKLKIAIDMFNKCEKLGNTSKDYIKKIIESHNLDIHSEIPSSIIGQE